MPPGRMWRTYVWGGYLRLTSPPKVELILSQPDILIYSGFADYNMTFSSSFDDNLPAVELMQALPSISKIR